MPEVYEALSRVNEQTGDPYVGTCTLVLGDGTQKVEFLKGRAKVPAGLARMVALHPNIEVVGLDGGAPAPVAPPALPSEEEAGLRARVAELEALVNRLANPTQPTGEPEPPAAPVDADGPVDVSEKVRAAMEHLAAEGEEVPEPGSALLPADGAGGRVGFVPETQDAQPRCQAAKADGGQCSNAATASGHEQACQIPAHNEQLAPS